MGSWAMDGKGVRAAMRPRPEGNRARGTTMPEKNMITHPASCHGPRVSRTQNPLVITMKRQAKLTTSPKTRLAAKTIQVRPDGSRRGKKTAATTTGGAPRATAWKLARPRSSASQ